MMSKKVKTSIKSFKNMNYTSLAFYVITFVHTVNIRRIEFANNLCYTRLKEVM